MLGDNEGYKAGRFLFAFATVVLIYNMIALPAFSQSKGYLLNNKNLTTEDTRVIVDVFGVFSHSVTLSIQIFLFIYILIFCLYFIKKYTKIKNIELFCFLATGASLVSFLESFFVFFNNEIFADQESISTAGISIIVRVQNGFHNQLALSNIMVLFMYLLFLRLYFCYKRQAR